MKNRCELIPLIMAIIVFLLITVNGITIIKARKVREYNREQIVEIIEKFGRSEDTNTDYSNVAESHYLGDNNITLYDNDMVVRMIMQDDVMIVFEFVLDSPESSNTIEVWNVMITYVDFSSREYLYLDYYFYNDFPHPNFASQTIKFTVRELAEVLQNLTIKDYVWIIGQLKESE